ncbi:hypothetical protein BpHYR1_013419, partial [Brachionus plicatilis]
MYQLIQTLYHPNKVSAKTLQVCKVLQILYLGGTHQDQLSRLKNFRDISNSLQRKIYEKFILPNSDSETTSAAYPPIFASIEI